MSERRFVIKEIIGDCNIVQIGDGQAIFHNRVQCITESELIKRFYRAWNYVQCAGLPKDTKIIDTLLHGEKEV